MEIWNRCTLGDVLDATVVNIDLKVTYLIVNIYPVKDSILTTRLLESIHQSLESKVKKHAPRLDIWINEPIGTKPENHS